MSVVCHIRAFHSLLTRKKTVWLSRGKIKEITLIQTELVIRRVTVRQDAVLVFKQPHMSTQAGWVMYLHVQ